MAFVRDTERLFEEQLSRLIERRAIERYQVFYRLEYDALVVRVLYTDRNTQREWMINLNDLASKDAAYAWLDRIIRDIMRDNEDLAVRLLRDAEAETRRRRQVNEKPYVYVEPAPAKPKKIEITEMNGFRFTSIELD